MNGKRASDIQHRQSEEKENELISKQKTLREDLSRATEMLENEST